PCLCVSSCCKSGVGFGNRGFFPKNIIVLHCKYLMVASGTDVTICEYHVAMIQCVFGRRPLGRTLCMQRERRHVGARLTAVQAAVGGRRIDDTSRNDASTTPPRRTTADAGTARDASAPCAHTSGRCSVRDAG